MGKTGNVHGAATVTAPASVAIIIVSIGRHQTMRSLSAALGGTHLTNSGESGGLLLQVCHDFVSELVGRGWHSPAIDEVIGIAGEGESAETWEWSAVTLSSHLSS